MKQKEELAEAISREILNEERNETRSGRFRKNQSQKKVEKNIRIS